MNLNTDTILDKNTVVDLQKPSVKVEKDKPELVNQEQIQKLENQLKVNFSKDEVKKIQNGESVYKENMHFQPKNKNGEGIGEPHVVNGSIQLSMKEGKLETKIQTKNEKLEIPNEILGNPITKKQKEQLEKGDFVAIKDKKTNQDLLLKVDNNLNKVVVKTSKEVGIPKQIGEYKLSTTDIEKLANKEALSPKVFEDKKTGMFFVANVKFDKDKSEISFENIKQVTPQQAQELKEKYNKPENVLSAVSNVAIAQPKQEISTENKEKQGQKEASKEVKEEKKESKIEISAENKLPKEIQEAIDKGDMKKLTEIKNQHPLTDKQVEGIAKDSKMNESTKVVILTALGKTDALDKIDNKLKIEGVDKKEPKIQQTENLKEDKSIKIDKKEDKSIKF